MGQLAKECPHSWIELSTMTFI